MHVPTAPALILGGLLAVAAVDATTQVSHRPSGGTTQHRSATASVVRPAPDAAPRLAKPALPRATVRRPAAAPAPRTHITVPRTHRSTSRPVTRSRPRVHRDTATTQADIDAAVRGLRGYQPGAVRWKLSTQYGQWGTADWYANVIYISPKVPHRLLRSVVIHEWDHILSVRAYGGDVSAAVAAMNQLFGGTGLVGAERAADCMALLSGATWTHYTSCSSDAWRAGARLLLEGRQL